MTWKTIILTTLGKEKVLSWHSCRCRTDAIWCSSTEEEIKFTQSVPCTGFSGNDKVPGFVFGSFAGVETWNEVPRWLLQLPKKMKEAERENRAHHFDSASF